VLDDPEGGASRQAAFDVLISQTASAVEALVPMPDVGRAFSARRRVRLADLDPQGRVRLDAVARLLQDIAIDDVDETGWGAPEHLWFVRTIRIDVLEPLLGDREVELVTWCSGVSTLAAG